MKPSERILQIINELRTEDEMKSMDDFVTYDAKAIALYLDEIFSILEIEP